MISAETLSRLLHKLYSAPSVPELWPEFLSELSSILKLTGAAILHHDMQHDKYNVELASGSDPSWRNLYGRYYGSLDVWRPAFLKKAEGEFAFGAELCPETETKRTEFYNDYLVKHDIRLFGAMATLKRPEHIEHISLYHSWKDRGPEKGTPEVMRLIFPHLQSALHLRRRIIDLAARSCSMESALDLMEYGIVLLNDRGCVLQTNYCAEALLRQSDGLRLRDGRIECDSHAESLQLHSLIEASVKAVDARTLKAGGTMLVSRRTLRPISITAVPLRECAAPRLLQATAVLFLNDPESQPMPPLDLLRQAYGLTPAEARLALILTQGHSLKEAAELCGIAHNTAKSQLKNIFTKTNVQRQAQLVRIVLSTPPLRQVYSE